MQLLLYLSLILCVIDTVVLSYPTGPPIDHLGFQTLCTDMNPKPGHTVEAQVNTPTPFKIVMSQLTYVHTDKIQVNITSKNGNNQISFRGFMLQARRVNRKKHQGTFSTFSSGTQGLHCNPGNNTTWGHSNNEVKWTSSVTWTPPMWDNGDIEFIATVVQGPNQVYWVDVKSPTLEYIGPSRPPTTEASGQSRIRSSTCFLVSIVAICIAVIILI